MVNDASQGQLVRTLSKWDLLAIGIGAVVGWSWVIYAGMWSSAPGTLGGIIAFALGGLLCSLVGLVYAELTAAFPRAGGDVIFAFEGLGEKAAIVVAWSMIFLWVGLILIETMMFPVILEGLGIKVPHVGELYKVAGTPVMVSFLIISLLGNAFFAYINYRGVRVSGIFQSLAVVILLAAAVFFCGSGLALGNIENAKPFFQDFKGLSLVLLMVPGFLSGFNAIPQASEETAIAKDTLGKMVVYTVWGSVLFYVLIVIGLSLAAPLPLRSGEGLVVVKAVAHLFGGSKAAALFVTFAALMGMLTTWNAAYLAASRLLLGLARAKFVPEGLARIHAKHGTPSLIIGILFVVSTVFCLLGTSRTVYVGIVNIFSMFLVLTWLIVSLSFLKLRKMYPDLERPYKVGAGNLVGWLSVLFSFAYLLVYTPISPGGLSKGEWIATGILVLIALIVYFTWNTRQGYLEPEERKRRLREA